MPQHRPTETLEWEVLSFTIHSLRSIAAISVMEGLERCILLTGKIYNLSKDQKFVYLKLYPWNEIKIHIFAFMSWFRGKGPKTILIHHLIKHSWHISPYLNGFCRHVESKIAQVSLFEFQDWLHINSSSTILRYQFCRDWAETRMKTTLILLLTGLIAVAANVNLEDIDRLANVKLGYSILN